MAPPVDPPVLRHHGLSLPLADSVIIPQEKDEQEKEERQRQQGRAAGQTQDDLRPAPPDPGALPQDLEPQDPFTAAALSFLPSRLMDQGDLSGAEAAFRTLLDVPSGLLDIQRWDLTVDLLSCSLLLGRSQEELAPLRTPALLHYCKATRKFTPSTSRMEFLWALLAQRDPEAALLSWRQFQHCAPRWPYPATLDTDRRLMELGLQRAQGQGFPLPPL